MSLFLSPLLLYACQFCRMFSVHTRRNFFGLEFIYLAGRCIFLGKNTSPRQARMAAWLVVVVNERSVVRRTAETSVERCFAIQRDEYYSNN